MTTNYLLLLLVAGSLLLSACKSGRSASSETSGPSGQEVISSEQNQQSRRTEETIQMRAEAMARYASGISYELNGETDLALEEYHKSALMEPANSSLVLNTSLRLIEKKQFDKAIELLSRATNQPGVPGGIYAMLARAHLQSGATNQALVASQFALKKAPDAIVAYQNLAEIYYHIGKTNELLQVLEQASGRTNVDEVFLVELADLYVKYAPPESRQDPAVKARLLDVLQRAAAKETKSPTLLQKMADAFGYVGEKDKATELYQQLLDKYGDLPLFRDLLRERLANLYLNGNDKTRAVEQFEAMIRDNPTKYPQIYFVLGTLYFEEKQFGKAAEFFEKTILFRPAFEQAYYDLAAAQLNANKAKEALETLAKAKEKFSTTFVGEYYSGLAQQKLQKFSEALKHYVAAEVIGKTTDPKRLDHNFFFQLGACSERSGDYTQAEKYFNRSLELKGDEPETLNYLGYMWAERGVNLPKAKELIEKALKIEPDNAAFLDSLGWVLFKLNQPENALVYLQKAAELMKEPDPTLFDHLGDVYSVLNQPDKAREYWQKSLELEPSDVVKKKLGVSL